MTMCNMEALINYFLEAMNNVNFKMVKCQGQQLKYKQTDLIKRNIHVKYQIQKLLARLKFSKHCQAPRVKVKGKKCWYPQGGLLS